MPTALPFFVIAAIALATILVLVLRKARQDVGPDRSELMALQNEWRAPAELLAGPIPRPVRLTREAKLLLAVAAAILFTGVFISAMVFKSTMRGIERQRALESETVVTEAQILRKSEESGGKNPVHYVFYRFEADGRTYLGKAAVHQRTYRGIREGDRVRVRYLAANPENNRLFAESQALPLWLALVPAFFLAVVWALTRAILVQRKLLQWGRPVGALVISILKTSSGKMIQNRFVDMGGNVVTGGTQLTTDRAPELRSTVTVLCDPQNPRRNTLYPAPYAQLAEPGSAAPGRRPGVL